MIGSNNPSLTDRPGDVVRLRKLYLDLIQESLIGAIYEDVAQDPLRKGRYDAQARDYGRDWPSQAHTMIGRRRMRNLRTLMEQVLSDRIPGDFIETGVWRGGACIYMRAILHAYDVADRFVWVADSFRGLPRPDAERYPADSGDTHHTIAELAVSLDKVKTHFAKYGLLDEQVRFLAGWFKDTLPAAPITQLALMRLDGDMYESTMDALTHLYPKLSPEGFVIIDDYKAAPCRRAVEDFRDEFGATEKIELIDGIASYWRKLR